MNRHLRHRHRGLLLQRIAHAAETIALGHMRETAGDPCVTCGCTIVPLGATECPACGADPDESTSTATVVDGG